jgi:hypothetical protein
MTSPVTMRIELPRERGIQRELALGQRVVLGRPMAGASPDRVNVPGRWLGVTRDGMVSAELLRLAYQDIDRGQAMIGWRTGAQHHPASIRFGTAPPGVVPDLDGEGRLVVMPGAVTRLFVSRLSTQQNRFVQRFVLEFTMGGLRGDRGGDGGGGNTLTSDDYWWIDLVDEWWTPRRREPESGQALTWRRCLEVTARLAAGAPESQLAEVVADGLRRRGYTEVDADAVRKAWNRAMIRLAEVLGDPSRRWMVSALAVPGLEDYLDRHRAGDRSARLLSGEPQIRPLLRGLRATGQQEWQ